MSTNERQDAIERIYNINPDFYTDIRVYNDVMSVRNRIEIIDNLLGHDDHCTLHEKLEMEKLLLLNKMGLLNYIPGECHVKRIDDMFKTVIRVLHATTFNSNNTIDQSELKRLHIITLLHTIWCNRSLESLQDEAKKK